MRKAFAAFLLFGSVLSGAGACLTVNIYFPAPEVRAAAEEIVDETWGEAAHAPSDSAPSAPAPKRADDAPPGAWLRMLDPSSAWAAEGQPNVDVSTAAIRALKASMHERAAQLRPHLTAGNVGVGRDGMLVVRDLQGVALGDQAKIRRLVEAENRDRQALYAAIAEANGYGRERIPEIQRIFAETWIEKAETGWPIQTPNGEWTKR